ncbi:MAG: DNA internalization-related competence protein ComEC/Rec2 [Pseudomonadota bacterium]
MHYLLAATVGIFSVSFFPRLPPPALLLVVGLLVPLAFYLRRYRAVCLLLGVLYGSLFGHYVIMGQLPQALSGQSFVVTGVVVGLPEHREKVLRFELLINKIEAAQADQDQADQEQVAHLLNKKLSLSWYRHGLIQKDGHLKLATGDVVQLSVKLRRPRGFVNPGGFDYQRFLLQKGIVATGYVKKDPANTVLYNRCQQRLWYSLHKIDCKRASLAEHFSAYFTSHQTIGPFLGLLTGDKRFITHQQWVLLRDTGTIHLLAISGLHIGLSAIMGFFFAKPWVFLWMWITKSNAGMAFAHLSSIAFALGYSMLSGFSLSSQRACIMVILVHIFWFLRSTSQPWLFVVIALLLIAILDPLAVHSSSFWLSFSAVIILLYCFSAYPRDKKAAALRRSGLYLAGLFKAQWVITLGLLIPSLLLLGGFSLSSPIANSVAVPFISLVIVPLLFIALMTLGLSPVLSELSATLAIYGLASLFHFLEWIMHMLPGFWFFDRGALDLWQLLPGMVGIAVMLSPKGIPRRYCMGLLCCLPLVLPARSHVAFALTFFEVGQGTAIVAKTPEHSLVYDVGLRFSSRFDSGEHIVAPYLLRSGRPVIDKLILSHGDSDHVGGKAGLLSRVSVEQIVTGEPNRVDGSQCVAGQAWRWNAVSFKILWPTESYLQQTHSNSNNRSCVLLIDYNGHTFLLPGDIDTSVEAQLLSSLPKDIDVLLVPHHGSRSSSHMDWVKHLRPQHVVFAAGFYNPYGHPHPAIVERYRQAGSTIHHTGKHGALRFIIAAEQKMIVRRERQKSRRYWYDIDQAKR